MRVFPLTFTPPDGTRMLDSPPPPLPAGRRGRRISARCAYVAQGLGGQDHSMAATQARATLSLVAKGTMHQQWDPGESNPWPIMSKAHWGTATLTDTWTVPRNSAPATEWVPPESRRLQRENYTGNLPADWRVRRVRQ